MIRKNGSQVDALLFKKASTREINLSKDDVKALMITKKAYVIQTVDKVCDVYDAVYGKTAGYTTKEDREKIASLALDSVSIKDIIDETASNKTASFNDILMSQIVEITNKLSEED